MYRVTDGSGHALWRRHAPDHEGEAHRTEMPPHRRCVELRQRPIQRRDGILVIQAAILDVTHHANDFPHHLWKECQGEALADWILVRPELPRHRFADQHDRRRRRRVGVGELAAAHNRNAHRLHELR